MPSSPYFHSDSLRLRFARHLQRAASEQRIDSDELHWLQGLCDPQLDRASAADPASVNSLILEDGSPVPLELACAVLLVRNPGASETLYLDTLSQGIERFSSREQLAGHLRQRFAVRAGLDPVFELQALEGSLFEQRMLLIAEHQVQTLNELSAALQELPSLQQVLEQALKSRLQVVWPAATLDLPAMLVQIIQSASPNTEQAITQVQTPVQAALTALTGVALPAGEQRRFLDGHGQVLGILEAADFKWQLADLKSEFEAQLADYWSRADGRSISRSERGARVLADGFARQVWALEHSAPFATDALLGLAAQPLGATPDLPVSRLSVAAQGQGPFKLVSLYLIHLPQGGYALYSPLKGIRLLADWQALTDLLNSPAGRNELHHYLSLDDQQSLVASQELQLHDYALAKPLFIDCIDSIIALQKRNLSTVLERPGAVVGVILAMVDDALDIRELIEPRLSGMDTGGRWLPAPTRFETAWAQTPGPVAWPYGPSASWMEQVSMHDSLLQEISRLRPGLPDLADQALKPWLTVLGCDGSLAARHIGLRDAGQVVANRPDDIDPVSGAVHQTSLVDVVLERLSTLRSDPLPAGSELFRPDLDPQGLNSMAWLPLSLIEHMLEHATSRLVTLCSESVATFYGQPLRQARLQTWPGEMMGLLRANLLRLELDVARRLAQFAPPMLDLLQQVLDRPVYAQRQAHGDAVTQVQALYLDVGGYQAPVGLSDAWVLQRPDQPGLGLLFWSRLTGLQPMQSLPDLQNWLELRLAVPEWRGRWLGLFDASAQQRVSAALSAARPYSVRLELIQGHFIGRMQQDEQQRQQQAILDALEQARQSRLKAVSCGRYFDLASGAERQMDWLDALAIRIQNMVFATLLPDWLSKATEQDLNLCADLMDDYYVNGNPADDYLADVPALYPFAHEQLHQVLRHDFPDQQLKPQDITVTMTHYIAAPVPLGSIPSGVAAATVVNSENLVSFSLNHFSRIQGASLTISLAHDTPLPAGLNAHYVAELVHRLDVGKRYQTLLATRFDPLRTDYAERRQRFMQQIPARLLLPALQMKLQGQLSQHAYDFIDSVLSMPDGKARQAVHEQIVVLRPLTLLPRGDMMPDAVEGLWLIGPLDTRQGPVVLHSQLNDDFTFKEYRDQNDLLMHLRSSGPLQTLVLDRVDPLVRKRYENGGLVEAHIPWSTEGFMDVPLSRPGEVVLGHQVVEGNALRHLFEATLQLLQHMSHKQAVTSAQADWASFVHLMTLGAEQVLLFLPGKLGMLVAAWQSQGLLRESAVAVADRHWGKALSEFSAALGMLVASRQERAEVSHTKSGLHLPKFSWRHSQISSDMQRRLALLEVHDVELTTLNYNQLYNLYQDLGTASQYAAVAGKVYKVHLHDGTWRITGEGGDGPKIRLNPNQQWELNLELGLRGGGMSARTTLEQQIQYRVDKLMIVEARGMDKIRAFSRGQARCIGMARQQALGYLQNALFNLNAPFAQALPARTQALLTDFFGVSTPGLVLIDSLRSRIDQLFIGLSEPSLSALDSPRFVTGTVKPGLEDLAAFVVNPDPLQRIYLGNLFFAPPVYIVESGTFSKAFNANDHFRAIALLHELSHLVCRTQDIAYLDASAPPLELLDESIPLAADYKRELQVLRDLTLSHKTPERYLFRTKDSSGWRDFIAQDGEVYHSILRLSAQPTLAAARIAFRSDIHVRRRVILSNADSLALLVALLGRERFS